MGDDCEECQACRDLKLINVKMEGSMERILERMNAHDKNEIAKKRERKEEARARRNNFVTIILFLFLMIIGFGKWLNDFTHQSDLRLQKIETALGVQTGEKI